MIEELLDVRSRGTAGIDFLLIDHGAATLIC